MMQTNEAVASKRRVIKKKRVLLTPNMIETNKKFENAENYSKISKNPFIPQPNLRGTHSLDSLNTPKTQNSTAEVILEEKPSVKKVQIQEKKSSKKEDPIPVPSSTEESESEDETPIVNGDVLDLDDMMTHKTFVPNNRLPSRLTSKKTVNHKTFRRDTPQPSSINEAEKIVNPFAPQPKYRGTAESGGKIRPESEEKEEKVIEVEIKKTQEAVVVEIPQTVEPVIIPQVQEYEQSASEEKDKTSIKSQIEEKILEVQTDRSEEILEKEVSVTLPVAEEMVQVEEIEVEIPEVQIEKTVQTEKALSPISEKITFFVKLIAESNKENPMSDLADILRAFSVQHNIGLSKIVSAIASAGDVNEFNIRERLLNQFK